MTKNMCLALVMLVAGACKSGKTAAPTTPTNAVAQDSTAPAENETERCYADCLKDGPGMPTTPEQFNAMSAAEKEEACNAACPGADVPVEQECEMNPSACN